MNGQSRAVRLGCWLCLGLSLVAAPVRAQEAPPPIGVMLDLMQSCVAYARPALASIMRDESHYFTGSPARIGGKIMVPAWNHPNAREAREELASYVINYAIYPDRPGHGTVAELRSDPAAKFTGRERFALCTVERRAQQIAAESRARPGASAKATLRPAQSR